MDERETVETTEYAVHTSKLCRVFGDLRAVEDLDLRVEPGTIYGFLGRNGAGKSTTIKMLTGILAPTSGSITLLGVSPTDEVEAARVRRRIGVVPEDLALFELLTGREYLNFVGTIYLLDEAMAEERVDELFEASIIALGPGHAILLPLALASFWCVIALTRQLQTFLAALMVNARLRGTIVAVCVMLPMLLIQAPNIYMQVELWGSLDRSDTGSKEEVKVEPLGSDEASEWLLATNLALPPGWLAYGAYQVKRDRYWPAVAGTLGLLAIVAWSLRRSYRSALHVYRRTQRRRRTSRSEPAPGSRTRRRLIAEAYWRAFPAIPATVGRASLRQWFRSPHGKQALLTPILVLLFAALAGLRLEEISKAQPYLGLGLAAFGSFGPVVFANNVFGWDRGGFRVLLATDPPRHLVLLGKNLGLMPITLGPGIALVVAVQLLWPQPATHFLACILQLVVFCLVFLMIGNHFSITAPWAASFTSLKQRGEAVASNLGTFLAGALAVGVIMLATMGVLALERLIADVAWPIPLYLISAVLELGLAAAWYRHVLLHQAETLPGQEERILEAITTPVD